MEFAVFIPQAEGSRARTLAGEAFHRPKRPVRRSWRMDQTCIRVNGQWRYLDHAVDKTGQPMDFLLAEQPDERAALGFLINAIRQEITPNGEISRMNT